MDEERVRELQKMVKDADKYARKRYVYGLVLGFMLSMMGFWIITFHDVTNNNNRYMPSIDGNVVCLTPNNFGTFEIGFVHGNSMNPTIMNNTFVIFQNIDEIGLDNIKVNDVVSYRMGNMDVFHRIIKIDGDKFVSKGDNNIMDDGWQSMKNITGVLAAVVY